MRITPVLTPGEQAARSLREVKCLETAQNLEHYLAWLDARYIELHTHYTCFVDAIRYFLDREEFDKARKVADDVWPPEAMAHFRYQGQAVTTVNDLFRKGNFVLHSGGKSTYKIDCDALTRGSWDAAAVMAVELLPPFGAVFGVPTGGIAFAEALSRYATDGCETALIAEDVVTTGSSMESYKDTVVPMGKPYIGVTLFCRGECPEWVIPVFQKTKPRRA